ncbi:MAG TPA: 2-oxoacid:acceptor oxidoreductase family protein [Anaerolinea sp.]|nr:2-oxoacid:acceptor oxidoreductase family protein [Anaerolinea sp.]
MQTELIISGFGGQGVLFAGQLLSYAAMDAGLEVTWIPSYGPEMRGGTANCTVIISDQEIGSPLVKHPTAVIAMNLPSLDKYENVVASNGVFVVNTSIIQRKPERTDVRWVMVPGNKIAEDLGDRRMTNMVMLGALLASLPVLSLEALEKSLAAHLPERHHKLLPLNYQALRKGAEYAVEKVG